MSKINKNCGGDSAGADSSLITDFDLCSSLVTHHSALYLGGISWLELQWWRSCARSRSSQSGTGIAAWFAVGLAVTWGSSRCADCVSGNWRL